MRFSMLAKSKLLGPFEIAFWYHFGAFLPLWFQIDVLGPGTRKIKKEVARKSRNVTKMGSKTTPRGLPKSSFLKHFWGTRFFEVSGSFFV